MSSEEKSNILQRVTDVIESHNLATKNTPVILMVSGGSDSTALAYISYELCSAGVIGNISIMHVNHGLRGNDAKGDVRFVAQLAELLDIPLFSYDIDIPEIASRTGENIEALARHERYRCANEALADLCRQTGSPVTDGRIFTAHTGDDRVENFYMRSIVGTGPGGFRGIRYRNGNIMRPLLEETRMSLQTYLQTRLAEGAPVIHDERGALWREDATNDCTDRFRAYVRHNMVPAAKQWNDKVVETLGRTMDLIADEDDMLDAMAADIEDQCARWLVSDDQGDPQFSEGFILLPDMAEVQHPIQRRVVHRMLKLMLGMDIRVDTASVEAVLGGFKDGKPYGGYVANIQGDIAVSANKLGVRVEPMVRYRVRRKRTKRKGV